MKRLWQTSLALALMILPVSGFTSPPTSIALRVSPPAEGIREVEMLNLISLWTSDLMESQAQLKTAMRRLQQVLDNSADHSEDADPVAEGLPPLRNLPTDELVSLLLGE